MKKFIRDNSQNFLTIWSVLTSIIILTYYSTNIYDHFGKSDTLWLVLVAFFIAILFLLVKSWLEKTSDLKVLYNDLLSEISNFKNATKEIYKKKNYLGLKMLSWRIENEISYALEIIDNSLRLPALKAFAYHRKIFGKVLLKLDKGDTYYTISNLDFWSKHKYGQQDFLKSNIEAATKGVFIKRIIVINKAILQNPQEHINDFTNLKSIVEKIYDAISQALPVVKHCLQIDFYLSDDIKKDDAYPVPFCFIENVTKDKWMIITPAMIDDERNQPEIRIRLITDKERDSDYINYQQMYEELKMKKLASHEIMYHEIQKLPSIETSTAEYHLNRASIKVLNELYSVAKVKSISGEYLVAIANTDGNTMVIETKKIIQENIINKDDNWRVIKFNMEMPLFISGFVSQVSRILAEKEISICIFSTYTAYIILVKENRLSEAADAIRSLGCSFHI